MRQTSRWTDLRWNLELLQVRSTFPRMTVHLGRFGEWSLRCETLPIHPDQAYDPRSPEPTQRTVDRLGRGGPAGREPALRGHRAAAQ